MSHDHIEFEHRPDGAATHIQLCLAAGAFMAMEAVIRDRIADAVGEDSRRTTVEVPLVAMNVLAEFAEACRTLLEQHTAPDGRQFSDGVAEIVHLQDPPVSAQTLISALGTTLDRVPVDSALPELSWFVCELGRVMACGMPQPPGTSDSASRLAFFERRGYVRWPIQSGTSDPST
jgi:hypothetical protein